ncbi:hypothetical protein BCR44DRAFT_1459605 [Catenaria anguillulae PL171]|uniref:MARVEL domain-containing protein n=1 Tax=Catenaria anguillulae PL171 TaxID=765915 RepID=A0A1Y2HS70_9FUNG|nr:hypothetical protein BCR44DRAFT_1459605 [Catenaria anguillulae PL171]
MSQSGDVADSPSSAMQSPNGDVVTVDPTSAPTTQQLPSTSAPSLPLLHSAPYNAARIGKVLRDKTHMFLSTQRTQYRSRWVTVKTPRFLLRVTQFIVSFMAVVALYTATFGVNYTSTSIGVSGINLASLTCVTSVVLTLTHLFNHLFPKAVGIRPSEEGHYSAVELALDAIYFALWALSASWQAANGSCPNSCFGSATRPRQSYLRAKAPRSSSDC